MTGLARHVSLVFLLAGAGCGAEALPVRKPAAHAARVPSPDAAAELRPLDAPSEPLAVNVPGLLAAPRDAEDLALDSQRKPEQLIGFSGIVQGMHVADLAAGGGYTTELLARAVGSGGRVYAQNSRFILDRFAAAPLRARLEKPVMANVTALQSEFDDPLPGITGLDAVVMVLFYHDMVWFDVDRTKLNRAIYAALRPGGMFVVVDHAAREEDGVTQAKTLHRIAEAVVREEVQQAGFQLLETGLFLRNPDDPRDWNAAPSAAGSRRGQSDRFVLKFVKPVRP